MIGPPCFRLFRVVTFLHHRFFFSRIRRSHRHPFLKVGDHRVGQFAALLLRRHREIGIQIVDCLDQQAFLGFERHHGGTACAAAQHGRSRIQQQFTFHFFRFRGVAFEAVFRQYRTDFCLEKLHLIRG